MTHYIFYSDESSNVTLPEWLTGSPANKQIKRLGFARECSNRSGDDFFVPFCFCRARRFRVRLGRSLCCNRP